MALAKNNKTRKQSANKVEVIQPNPPFPSSATAKTPLDWPADNPVRKRTDELVPYARNSNTHSEEQIAQLAAAMQEWGFTMPVLIDEANGIIAGHGRILAAQKLGLVEVPCLVAKGWTEDQKRAYVIADNQLARNSVMDKRMLAVELESLKSSGFDIGLVGLGATDISSILKGQARRKTDPDDAPDVATTAFSKPGDLWLLGEHRVLCGDATSGTDMRRLMAGEQAALLLTDPPYGVDYEGKTAEALKIKNDVAGSDFRAFLRSALSTANAALRPGGAFYIWYADVQTLAFAQALEEAGLKLRQVLIWKKNSLVMGRKDYHFIHEPCLYGWRDGEKHLWTSDRKQTTVLEFDRPQRNGEHPTMKPVALMEYQLKNNTNDGELVLDPFLGSGSTLIAADQAGRRCFGLELDPRYVDVIVKRWQNFTGQAAVHEDGRTFDEVCNGAPA